MGFMRKALSVHTAGLIDFRSDKERAARNSRLSKQATNKARRTATREAGAQNDLLAEQNRLIAEQNELLRRQAEGR